MIAVSATLRELSALARSDAPPQTARIAREFEALVMTELLRSASKPLAGEGLLDGGSAGRMAREQFYSELARTAVQAGGLGLAQDLETEMAESTDGAGSQEKGT